MSNFIKKLFYKRKGSTKKYKLFGLTLVKISKKPTKKIIKILGIKFTKKIKKKKQKLIFAPELKNCTKLFDNNKSFKRLAVFASFNKDGLILDYVVYYLKELKKVVDGIIFVTDNPILPTELEKIKDFIVYAECQRHEEYDFGSYKRGFFWAKKNGLLKDCEELVFCNDSCYGPVYPFSEMFEEMATRSCDFWGMTANEDKNKKLSYHIQSYFLVFKKHLFSKKIFEKFLIQIQKEESFKDVVYKYEINLSQFLYRNGFMSDCYVKFPLQESLDVYNVLKNLNPTFFPLTLIKKHKAPLIKVKAMNGDFGILLQEDSYNTLEYIKTVNSNLYNMMTITFSVIMPAYNRAFCIENAINSLLTQTYQNFELIIVDDGSTDKTEDLIKNKYSKEIKSKKLIYKKLSKNAGVCHARNVGIKLAKNEYIAYLDTDNKTYPEFLEIFKNTIIKNSKKKTFYAKIKNETNNKTVGEAFNFNKLCKGNFIDLGVFVHHKSLITELGGFDEELKRLVDWDLIIRYTHVFTPIFIDKPLLAYSDDNNYRRISNSESYTLNKQKILEKIRILNEQKNIYKKPIS